MQEVYLDHVMCYRDCNRSNNQINLIQFGKCHYRRHGFRVVRAQTWGALISRTWKHCRGYSPLIFSQIVYI